MDIVDSTAKCLPCLEQDMQRDIERLLYDGTEDIYELMQRLSDEVDEAVRRRDQAQAEVDAAEADLSEAEVDLENKIELHLAALRLRNRMGRQ